MKIKAYFDREDKEHVVELPKQATVKDLLLALAINPVSVLVSKNNEILLDNEELSEGDELKLYSVISGG
jgi:sulfur carrier protein ThiS